MWEFPVGELPFLWLSNPYTYTAEPNQSHFVNTRLSEMTYSRRTSEVEGGGHNRS